MWFQNLDIQKYPFKEIKGFFETFPGKIYPWIGNFSQSPTGEEYITVTATDFYYYLLKVGRMFNESDRDDILYIRRLPTPSTYNNELKIYSRFLISKKPMIQFADGNKNRKE